MLSIYQQICQNLEKKYKDAFPVHSYLNNTHLKEQKNGEITLFVLSVPSAFHKERIDKKILPLLRQELTHLLQNSSFQIQSVVEKTKPTPASPLPKQTKSSVKKQFSKSSSSKQNIFNSNYTFDKFVSGPSNLMAVSAVKNLAEKPVGNTYSPLFIYGKTGLGKTHLLHAMGQKISQNHPHLLIQYLSAERFLYEYVQAIRTNSIETFRQQYRQQTQILLIDDIQAIEKGPASQEEFFHTFNTLSDRKGLVVCTCDRLPREITKMETRLQTRLAGGLVVQIENPDPETRLAILQKKAHQKSLSLSQEALLFLAQSSTNSIRELEGNLNKVKMACDLQSRPPSLSFIKKLFLKELAFSKTPDGILKQTADAFEISITQMLSVSRSKKILQARQQAILSVHKTFPQLTLSEIGQIFGGKSHSTILYTLKKFK